MMEGPSRQDIIAVVIGVLLMLPLMIGVALAFIIAIDQFMLADPDALLAD
jgi:hypothetical protein